MPYRIDSKKTKAGLVYLLWNLHKRKYVAIPYRSRASAISAGKNFIRFREKKKAHVSGNQILPNK